VRHGGHRGGAPRGDLRAGAAPPAREREFAESWSV